MGFGVLSSMPTNAIKGRREVASGKRPNLREAIKQVIGSGTLSLSEVMDALTARGWAPVSDNPREYVAQTIGHLPETFEVVSRGTYRVREIVRTNGDPQMSFTVTIPGQYARGIALVADVEGKSIADLISEVLRVGLSPRIYAALEQLKLSDSMKVVISVVNGALSKALVNSPAPAPIPRKRPGKQKGYYAWTREADVRLVKYATDRTLGWAAVAVKMTAEIGHKVSAGSVSGRWARLKSETAYLKTLTRDAEKLK